jgi:hypothetical protein
MRSSSRDHSLLSAVIRVFVGRVLSGNSTEVSGGSVVVPKQPTVPRATADWAMRWLGRFRHDQPVLQALMVPLPVIVFVARETTTDP